MLDARKRFRGNGEKIENPVLYVIQLVGIALGLGHEELGLNMNTVSPMPMVEKVYERMAQE
jgi:heterodisulfide reductase subunit B2